MRFDRPLPPSVPSREEKAAREIADQLESENPRWIVLYGGYSKEFVCFPKFNAPTGTILAGRYPAAITDRMRRMEELINKSKAA